jgi:hypothetical protein
MPAIMKAVERTVVDVLRDVIGPDLSACRVAELTVDEIAALADAVQMHYQNWRAPEGADLRVDLGGWVGGHFAAPETREVLTTMLLYADQVVLHDPLADWFCAERSRLRPLDAVRYRNGAQLMGSEGHILVHDGWVVHQTIGTAISQFYGGPCQRSMTSNRCSALALRFSFHNYNS